MDMEPLTPDDPRLLGDFGTLCRIGVGGFGEVFLARRTAGGTLAAVKLIRQDIADSERLRPRFASEVEALGRAAGRGVPELLGSDPAGRRPWLATRYIPGPSLQQLVDRAGPLPERSVWALAAGLADTFRVLHADGLYHRDLKPSNVLITRARAWVIDFSLVRLVGDPRLTSTADAMGSFQYAAPEQADGLGRAQSEADVFALGASLLFAATGHPPRDGQNQMEIRLRAMTDPPDLRGLDRGPLRELIADCMEAAPEHRPSTAAVLARAREGGGSVSRCLPLPGRALAVLDRHRDRLRTLAGVGDDFSADDAFPAERSHHRRTTAASAPATADGTPVRTRWTWRCYDWLRGAPVVHGDLVLAVTAAGALHALDRATGVERWHLDLGHAARGGLVRAGDTVAMGTADGSTHVVRIRPSGPAHSREDFPAPVHAVALAPGEERGGRTPPLVVCSRRDLHLFDPAVPAPRWSAPGVGVVAGTPAVDEHAVYCRTDDGSLGAWRLTDGAALWRIRPGGASFAGPVAGPGGVVYTASADGTVAAVAARTGGTRWSRRLDGTVHHPPVQAGTTLVVATVEGEVTALNAADGSVRWSARGAPHGGLSSLGIGHDTVYAADRRGVRALSGTTGDEWWRWDVGGVSGLHADSDGLVVGGLDGVLRSVNWPSATAVPAAGPWPERVGKKSD